MKKDILKQKSTTAHTLQALYVPVLCGLNSSRFASISWFLPNTYLKLYHHVLYSIVKDSKG